MQQGNTHDAFDTVNIKDIHKKFGTKGIDKLKFLSKMQKVTDRVLKRVETYRPLNYIDYNRDRAFAELKEFCGFEYYGRKHLENIFTAFAQLYWFPKKFKVDKRKSHLSSMIVSGQLTREEALKLLEEPMYDNKLMSEYIEIIKHEMNISDEEFEALMSAPAHQHTDYKYGKYRVLKFFKKVAKAVGFVS